jgi:putative transposase
MHTSRGTLGLVTLLMACGLAFRRFTSPSLPNPFATVRLRTTAAKRFKRVENATALIWKILQVAESTFRGLKGAELLPAVDARAQYVDGVQLVANTQQKVAA